MDYIYLLIEFIFFGIGVYLYLYSRGFLKAKDPVNQKKMDEYRAKNETWMRYGGLFLAAIFLFNIVLHIRDLIGG